jgi:hypothetical protein
MVEEIKVTGLSVLERRKERKKELPPLERIDGGTAVLVI